MTDICIYYINLYSRTRLVLDKIITVELTHEIYKILI